MSNAAVIAILERADSIRWSKAYRVGMENLRQASKELELDASDETYRDAWARLNDARGDIPDALEALRGEDDE